MVAEASRAQAGSVLAVGGGGTPRAVIRDAIGRAREGRKKMTVLILPYASTREGAGEASAEMWREEGADRAVVGTRDQHTVLTALQGAQVIWMGGGSQSRLLDELERLELVEPIRKAHARGAIVGGTSAGAAVLGSVCIAGSPEPEAYVQGSMQGRPGLALVARTIVDQHFRERKREGRLLTAVLDAGGLRGIGISESTAVWFTAEGLEVAGEGVAVVVDATDLEPGLASPSGAEAMTEEAEHRLWSARGIELSILGPGRHSENPR